MKRISIAIDGFSSCGKSTLAKQLAHDLGYTYIDTGAMYRAVALYALDQGLIVAGKLLTDELLDRLHKVDISFHHDMDTGQNITLLNGKNVESRIRDIEVSRHVILVSPIPAVRAKLVALQQALGVQRGVVMDGRDIGTVVLPDAELKIYMTADPEVRARRRYDEIRAKGVEIDFASVLDNIHKRDHDDVTRTQDPLLKAADAIEIDNSFMNEAEQFRRVRELAENALTREEQGI